MRRFWGDGANLVFALVHLRFGDHWSPILFHKTSPMSHLFVLFDLTLFRPVKTIVDKHLEVGAFTFCKAVMQCFYLLKICST